MSATNDTLRIGPPAPAQWAAALDLAWSHLPLDDRQPQVSQLLEQAQTHSELLTGLLAAHRGGQLVGAVWAQIQPGRTAFLFPPQALEGEPAETVAALLHVLVGRLDQRRCRVVQVLLPTDHGPTFDLLRSAGFEHYADLLYLASDQRSFPDQPPQTELEFERYAESEQQRLIELIEATYIDSRDCPRLNGIRDTSDILAGYRATGEFDPARWLFVRHAGKDVGCLLLAEHPMGAAWEVAYVGLLPPSRGRGWGLVAVRQAQWLARQAQAHRLLLAVDAANLPAIATYAAAGFIAWDRRTVMLRIHTP